MRTYFALPLWTPTFVIPLRAFNFVLLSRASNLEIHVHACSHGYMPTDITTCKNAVHTSVLMYFWTNGRMHIRLHTWSNARMPHVGVQNQRLHSLYVKISWMTQLANMPTRMHVISLSSNVIKQLSLVPIEQSLINAIEQLSILSIKRL